MNRLSLGIDIGGTFSDLVLHDATGRHVFSHKELTTHDDPARGVMSGLDRMFSANDLAGKDVARVVHATTLFTNALLERRGARTGLITTRGFGDLIEIGRERRYELFDLNIRRPEPLVPRDFRREVGERIDRDGRVRVALDVSELLQQVSQLVADGMESLAIVFLHSYKNPEHEKLAAREIARTYPRLSVSYSFEVSPVIREGERLSTTAANAYIKPLATRYLDSLADGLAERGIASPLLMMLSSGGLSSLDDAKQRPVKVLESGPAAGVIAAAAFGREDGESHLLAFDMGGTTAKLCVVANGKPSISRSFEAARQKRFTKGSGLPISISTLELIEIGAGGGSIARKSNLDLLKVGPDSAGSSPGPACYGLGGLKPTVTDANFALGYLDPIAFAGGSIKIDLPAARVAISTLATECAMSPERAAWGIVDLVNETMARAAAVHIAEHGKDPRNFLLTATGGGGPLHAYYVAKKLGVRRVLCPAGAGVASAIGLLRAPGSVEAVRSVVLGFERIDWELLEAGFAELETASRKMLDTTGTDRSSARAVRQADFRLAGQAFEMVIPTGDGPYTYDGRGKIFAAFERHYSEKYGRTPKVESVELINIRVVVTAAEVDLPESWQCARTAPDEITGAKMRPVYFPEFGEHRDTRLYDRFSLAPDEIYTGPALIEEPMSTIVVGPGARFQLRPTGHVMITLP